MLSLLFRALVLILIVLAFWFPKTIIVIIFILYGFVELSVFIPMFSKVKASERLGLTHYEEKLFSKYYIYFMYPFGARDYSVMLSTAQMSAFILTPLFWYKGFTIPAIIFAVNYFIAAFGAVRLNPLFFIGEEIKKGKTQFLREYEGVESVIKKIEKLRDVRIKEIEKDKPSKN